MTFQHEVDRIFVIDWSRCYFYSPYKCYITETNFKWTEYQIALNINKYIDFTPWDLCFQICSNIQLIWQSRVYVYIIANITWNKKKIIESKSKWKRYTRFFIRSFSFSTLNAKRSSDFWTTLFLLLCGGGKHSTGEQYFVRLKLLTSLWRLFHIKIYHLLDLQGCPYWFIWIALYFSAL